MPLTKEGKKVMKAMKEQYGDDEGEKVFYATMKKRGMEDQQHKKETSKDDGETAGDVQVYHGKPTKLKPLKGLKKKAKE